jgi:hypothetical protein
MRARRDGFLSDSFLTVLFWDGTKDSSLRHLPEALGVGCNAIVRVIRRMKRGVRRSKQRPERTRYSLNVVLANARIHTA